MANKLWDVFQAYCAVPEYFSKYLGMELNFWIKCKTIILHPIEYYRLGKAALRIEAIAQYLKENGCSETGEPIGKESPGDDKQ